MDRGYLEFLFLLNLGAGRGSDEPPGTICQKIPCVPHSDQRIERGLCAHANGQACGAAQMGR
jgi:hypothetical protein